MDMQRPCARCQQPSEKEYSTPLCVKCRDALCRNPYPGWLIAAALGVLVALGLASSRIPRELKHLSQFESAQRRIDSGKAADAIPLLKDLSTEYPDSSELVGWLAYAELAGGSPEEGMKQLKTLSPKVLSGDLNKKLDTLFKRQAKGA